MSLLKIGPRGQIILPKKFREALGLSPGDSLALFQHADELILRPVKDTLLDLRGSVTVRQPQDFQAVRDQVKKAIGQKATKRDA